MLNYPLNDSVILDSSATIYVCNNYTRFKDFCLAPLNKSIFAGDGIVPIQGYGTIIVYLRIYSHAEIVQLIDLLNTMYVPSFYISVAALRKFIT